MRDYLGAQEVEGPGDATLVEETPAQRILSRLDEAFKSILEQELRWAEDRGYDVGYEQGRRDVQQERALQRNALRNWLNDED